MTNNQTVVIVIILLVYLVGLGFLFDAIGTSVPAIKNDTSYESKFLCTDWSYLTFSCTEKTTIGNIVSGIAHTPPWVNVIFILIPFVLLIILGILLLIHG